MMKKLLLLIGLVVFLTPMVVSAGEYDGTWNGIDKCLYSDEREVLLTLVIENNFAVMFETKDKRKFAIGLRKSSFEKFKGKIKKNILRMSGGVKGEFASQNKLVLKYIGQTDNCTYTMNKEESDKYAEIKIEKPENTCTGMKLIEKIPCVKSKRNTFIKSHRRSFIRQCSENLGIKINVYCCEPITLLNKELEACVDTKMKNHECYNSETPNACFERALQLSSWKCTDSEDPDTCYIKKMASLNRAWPPAQANTGDAWDAESRRSQQQVQAQQTRQAQVNQQGQQVNQQGQRVYNPILEKQLNKMGFTQINPRRERILNRMGFTQRHCPSHLSNC